MKKLMHKEVKWLGQDQQYWIIISDYPCSFYSPLTAFSKNLFFDIETVDSINHLSTKQDLFAKEINLPALFILPTLTAVEFLALTLLPSSTTSKIPSLLFISQQRAAGNI